MAQFLSHRDNVRKCGRVRIAPYVELREMRNEDGSHGSFGGLVTCGAVWLCPVCQAKVAARRALEVSVVTAKASAEGRVLLFGALTLHHSSTTGLDVSLGTLREAWRWLGKHKTFRALRDQAGGIDFVRAVEINIGANGWHPHQHPLVALGGALSDREASDLGYGLADLWLRAVEAAGGQAAPYAQSLQVVRHASEVGAYITDQTFGGKHQAARLDMELTSSQNKAGVTRESGTASHWQVLSELAEGIDVQRNVARYYELEAYTRGVRQLSWSRRVRQWAELTAEKTDAQIAAEREGEVIALLTPKGFDRLQAIPNGPLHSLELLEREGWTAVADFWQLVGVEYVNEAGEANE